MRSSIAALLLTASLPALLPAQRAPLTFAGIGRQTELNRLASAFPHSDRVGNAIRVAPEDVRDHIYGIEVSGSGASQRITLSFERPGSSSSDAALRYPACAEAQSLLQRHYGMPSAMRTLPSASVVRSERQWKSGDELLTLTCFMDDHDRLLAESVRIEASGR
jgi:hypothetical protein